MVVGWPMADEPLFESEDGVPITVVRVSQASFDATAAEAAIGPPSDSDPDETMLAAVRAWMRREIRFGAFHDAARQYMNALAEVGE